MCFTSYPSFYLCFDPFFVSTSLRIGKFNPQCCDRLGQLVVFHRQIVDDSFQVLGTVFQVLRDVFFGENLFAKVALFLSTFADVLLLDLKNRPLV